MTWKTGNANGKMVDVESLSAWPVLTLEIPLDASYAPALLRHDIYQWKNNPSIGLRALVRAGQKRCCYAESKGKYEHTPLLPIACPPTSSPPCTSAYHHEVSRPRPYHSVCHWAFPPLMCCLDLYPKLLSVPCTRCPAINHSILPSLKRLENK